MVKNKNPKKDFIYNQLFIRSINKKIGCFCEHPILGEKIGQIEIIQPAFYDRLSVPPVFLIMVMSVSNLGYETHQMTLQV